MPRNAAKRCYAVAWSSDGESGSGRLELRDDRLELHGRGRGRSIALSELVGVSIARGKRDRLHGLPVLALALRGAAPMRIASLEGIGALHELAERVSAG
jgi:hypothetical protein